MVANSSNQACDSLRRRTGEARLKRRRANVRDPAAPSGAARIVANEKTGQTFGGHVERVRSELASGNGESNKPMLKFFAQIGGKGKHIFP